jgi:hypothetical protein
LFTVLALVTDAVNTTDAPKVDGLAEDATVVVVAADPAAVVISIVQPPEIEPESPTVSSTTYRFHVPFGVAPAKNALSVSVPAVAGVPYGAAGAGAGKRSDPPV